MAPCFNERENVAVLHQRLAVVVAGLSGVACELVFIDNASSDGTQDELRKLVAQSEHQPVGGLRVRVILNQRNFGHVRSPYHGLLAVSGDAVIVMASDLQDPPELIPAFVEKWREGSAVVMGQKIQSE